MNTSAALLRQPHQAAALLDPLRRRILERLREPGSAASIARDLGLPRQKVNYHLRELEKAGLVQLVEERVRGNCVERIVRGIARSYLISPDALGDLARDPEGTRDRFSSAYLVAAAAAAIRDIGRLRERADRAGKRLATLTLQTELRFASASRRKAFAEELATEVARLSAKYNEPDAPDGRAFRLMVGAYPAIRDEDEEDEEAGSQQNTSASPIEDTPTDGKEER